MHVLDYQRALGELLELDDTIRASIEHLKKIGEYDDTLIVITADHGHGFDVLYASLPSSFPSHPLMARPSTQRRRRHAVPRERHLHDEKARRRRHVRQLGALRLHRRGLAAEQHRRLRRAGPELPDNVGPALRARRRRRRAPGRARELHAARERAAGARGARDGRRGRGCRRAGRDPAPGRSSRRRRPGRAQLDR